MVMVGVYRMVRGFRQKHRRFCMVLLVEQLSMEPEAVVGCVTWGMSSGL